METKPASYWIEQKRSRPKRWYLGNASAFERQMQIVKQTAYPMDEDGDGFEGFAVCFRGNELFQTILNGAKVECFVITRNDDHTDAGTFAVSGGGAEDDYSISHDHVLTYKPDLLKSPRSHPFIFKTLEEAQSFVDSLQSITVSHSAHRREA